MQGHSLFVALAVAAARADQSITPQLHELGASIDNEYLRFLDEDPLQSVHAPNRQAREVHSGHYVLVRPTPLPSPRLVVVSDDVCIKLLRLDTATCQSEAFARLFSGGDISQLIPGFGVSWATPYALSIYGQEVQPNGAGPNGNGYGDGRAISIAQVSFSRTEKLELQLKGGGRTPFCRNADGRAVLRSSTREFLASEAMAALGVPTTRALSLVASKSETVQRPWYRNASTDIAIGMHKPVKHGGDLMRSEATAITTRVATSFLRVGQIELYARRARKGDEIGRRQLEALARFTLNREYHDVDYAVAAADDDASPPPTLAQKLLKMAYAARKRFAFLGAEWLRVGYTQSNFNADNCLLGGVTVDYGPFGFLEKYTHPPPL